MDCRKMERLPVDLRLKFKDQSNETLKEILRLVVKRRLDAEGITDLRFIYSVPNHIPDEQVERWIVAWVERRDKVNA